MGCRWPLPIKLEKHQQNIRRTTQTKCVVCYITQPFSVFWVMDRNRNLKLELGVCPVFILEPEYYS
jgi:hypothetical protein